MPRQPRLVVPDLPVHVVHRGNNRMTCFADGNDYLVYLSLMREAAKKFGCTVHAYCLMGNHVHVLLTPAAAHSCGLFMHCVAQRYAYYFNRRLKRTGTLWDGRFRSCVVESGSYVIACSRYIELNPVRAGLVGAPAAYPWSSYLVNSGSAVDPLVSVHAELLAIGTTAYARMLEEVLTEEVLREIRLATNGGYPLGSHAFKAGLKIPNGRKVIRGRPGPAAKGASGEERSEPVPDLFSGGGAS
jgi:putative transposase